MAVPQSGNTLGHAQELQGRLQEFAGHDTEGRAARIADLVGFVFETVDARVLAAAADPLEKPVRTVDYRPYMQAAVRRTLRTPLEVGDETMVPWGGGYNVVALHKTGLLMGAETAPPVTAPEQNRDLAADTLLKAVIRLHLSLDRVTGGIDEGGNAALISELLPGRKQYEGAVRMPSMDIIAASGCELRPEYAATLLPDARQDGPGVDSLAASADVVFATQVGAYWYFGDEVRPRSEPEQFRRLRAMQVV